jgi:hypothetical protein
MWAVDAHSILLNGLSITATNDDSLIPQVSKQENFID